MELCGTGNTSFQNDKIIEETLTTTYFEKKLKPRSEYVEKFKEYKSAYKVKYIKCKRYPNNEIYRQDVDAFIRDMRPYNLQLKNNEITRDKYLYILNQRKDKKIYESINLKYKKAN